MKLRKVAADEARTWTKQELIVGPPPPTGALPEPANYTIFWVEALTLQPAPWNPPARTTRRAVLDLIRRMESEGFEVFRPILLADDGVTIGDGHRRWTAAQYLGMPRVPAIYTGKSVEDLWAGNAGSRKPLNKEWMLVHALGGVDLPTPRLEDQVQQLTVILGDEGVRYLVEREISPDVYRTVWRIGMYCKNTQTRFLRATVYWLIKHKMVDKASKAMRGKESGPIDPRILAKAIEDDRPLVSSWGM